MPKQECQVIVMANQKGGCGKTTGAVSLAAGLARMNYSVCLVDLDSQCNATQSFSDAMEAFRTEETFTALDIYLKNRKASDIALPLPLDRYPGGLRLIPGHRALAQAHAKLEADLRAEVVHDEKSPEEEDDIRLSQRGRLRRSIESLKSECDYIVLDTPPELGFLLSTALQAADWFCLPVFPSQYDLDGLKRLTLTVKKIKERSNPKLNLLGVLVGNFDKSTRLDSEILDVLVRNFKGQVFPPIHRGVRIREAASHGVTIYDHAPDSSAAHQFEEVCRQVVARVQSSLGIIQPEEQASEQPSQPEVVAATSKASPAGETPQTEGSVQ